jgi:hypothetical protein
MCRDAVPYRSVGLPVLRHCRQSSGPLLRPPPLPPVHRPGDSDALWIALILCNQRFRYHARYLRVIFRTGGLPKIKHPRQAVLPDPSENDIQYGSKRIGHDYFDTNSHGICRLIYHFVLVTKFRRQPVARLFCNRRLARGATWSPLWISRENPPATLARSQALADAPHSTSPESTDYNPESTRLRTYSACGRKSDHLLAAQLSKFSTLRRGPKHSLTHPKGRDCARRTVHSSHHLRSETYVDRNLESRVTREPGFKR